MMSNFRIFLINRKTEELRQEKVKLYKTIEKSINNTLRKKYKRREEYNNFLKKYQKELNDLKCSLVKKYTPQFDQKISQLMKIIRSEKII